MCVYFYSHTELLFEGNFEHYLKLFSKFDYCKVTDIVLVTRCVLHSKPYRGNFLLCDFTLSMDVNVSCASWCDYSFDWVYSSMSHYQLIDKTPGQLARCFSIKSCSLHQKCSCPMLHGKDYHNLLRIQYNDTF